MQTTNDRFDTQRKLITARTDINDRDDYGIEMEDINFEDKKR